MLREEWYTLSKIAHVSIEEKKSIFIADAAPVSSAKEAESFLSGVKKKYPDARHHVFAWRTGGSEILQRYSDDGEPSGTAGLPVLDVLRKNNIDDAILVVTRYFGGVLLGTGGLVRAYGRAAFLALTEAEPTICRICELYHVMISYSHLERLRFALQKAGYIVEEPEFGMDPVLPVCCQVGQKDALMHICMDMTAGQAVFEYVGDKTVSMGRVGELTFE